MTKFDWIDDPDDSGAVIWWFDELTLIDAEISLAESVLEVVMFKDEVALVEDSPFDEGTSTGFWKN